MWKPNLVIKTKLQTAQNIKKVSLIFFIVLGIGNLLSGLMMANNNFMPLSLIVNHILEIPFALTALIYGFSSVRSELEGDHKIINIFFIILTLLIFGALVYINLFLPDKITT